MKTALTFGLTLCLPFILSAQQKGITTQDLQKQMNEMKLEMQTQISLLQDSIALLQKQLNQQQDERNGGYKFYYQNPLQGEMDPGKIPQSDFFKDHLWDQSWNFKIPDIPYEKYHIVIPLPRHGYYYDWKQLQIPQCPKAPREKHKHEWMKMLPFGNLFKS